MDAGLIAEITNLSVEKVRQVQKRFNNDEDRVAQAVNQYLENKSGPFREVDSEPKKASEDWADAGKPRCVRNVCARITHLRTSGVDSTAFSSVRRK